MCKFGLAALIETVYETYYIKISFPLSVSKWPDLACRAAMGINAFVSPNKWALSYWAFVWKDIQDLGHINGRGLTRLSESAL